MPSQDTFHQEHPATNRRLARSLSTDQAKRLGIDKLEPLAVASRTARPVRSSRVQALAARLGVDPEELAGRIPEDNHRRLKYPVFEHQNEDGTSTFTHDPGIVVDGRLGLLRTDHADGEIKRNAPTPRDTSGRFTK